MRSDDEKLVSQTLTGDRDAFGVLVHKYQEMVYAYAFQKVRNEEDARISRKRSSGGHITISINSGSRIDSEVGSIRSCPTSAIADS